MGREMPKYKIDKIYIFLREKGCASLNEIVQHVDMRKNKAVDSLNILISRGLVYRPVRGIYCVADPCRAAAANQHLIVKWPPPPPPEAREAEVKGQAQEAQAR